MPQFDTAFFASEIFWSLVSFVVLFLLLRRYVLPRVAAIIDERTRLIQAEIDEAKRQRAEAEELKRVHAERLEAIGDEAQAMFDKADRRIREERDRIMGEWKVEMERRKRDFREETEMARHQAIRDIRKETAAIVVEATEKLIHRHVGEKEAQSMIASAIDDLDRQTDDDPYQPKN